MEGLRGFAVALVFVVHYASLVEPWLAARSLTAATLDAAHSIGHAGVDLFFVLSGFLIYGHLIERRPRLGTYALRRIQRIYPTFLVVLTIYVALSVARPDLSKIPPDPTEAALYLAANLLLLPGLLPIEPVITVAWSLSYEAFFYVLMPLLVACLRLTERSGAWRLGFGALLAAAALASFAMAGGPVRLTLFIAGMLLHELTPRRSVIPAPLALLAAGAGLALLVVPMPGPAGQALRAAMLGGAFLVLCWSCFTDRQGVTARLFSWGPMRWLGNMSYSYYLIHGLALQVLFSGLAIVWPPAADGRLGWWLLPFAFAFTLVPSAVLFLAVERPLSLASTRSARPTVPSATAAIER